MFRMRDRMEFRGEKDGNNSICKRNRRDMRSHEEIGKIRVTMTEEKTEMKKNGTKCESRRKTGRKEQDLF